MTDMIRKTVLNVAKPLYNISQDDYDEKRSGKSVCKICFRYRCLICFFKSEFQIEKIFGSKKYHISNSEK